MTYELKSFQGDRVIRETFDTAEAAVNSIDALRGKGARVEVVIDSAEIRPDSLTESERLIIIKGGRLAAAKGDPEDRCPYPDDIARRTLWLEGFHSQE